jgi:hypothetical protein
MVAGMGQYPNLGVADAFVCISHGDTQYVVRASRELGSNRLDTQVGPFRIEVLEGLQKLRLVLEPNEWGVSFDLAFEGQVPAQEEPKQIQKQFVRTTMETSRFAQVGRYSGTLTVAGQSYDVTPERWMGARDRSWGVRPVGEAQAPGIAVKMERSHGFFHNWLPMQFDDYLLKVFFDEDAEGHRMIEESVKIYNHGIDKPNEQMGTPRYEFSFIPGTREISKAVIRLAHSSGQDLTVTTTPLRTVYLMAGSGYIPTPEWTHGMYQGELKVEGLSYDMSTPEKRKPFAILNETLSRFELSTGEVGYGMHENLIVGVHKPSGFNEPGSVA